MNYKWLKTIHIEDDAPIVVRVVNVRPDHYNEDDEVEHLFLKFDEYEKEFGMSNTAIESMIDMFGDNVEKWIGESVTLVVGKAPNKLPRIELHPVAKKKAKK